MEARASDELDCGRVGDWIDVEVYRRIRHAPHVPMNPSREMTIPNSGTGVTIQLVMILISVVFLVLAVVNIFNGVGLIASVTWIVFVTMLTWSGIRKEGGLIRFLNHHLGELLGRHYAEVPAHDPPSREIRFGYELLGHRFVKQSISIDAIETVEWCTGQATSMAGRDMHDRHVCLWYDHGDPAKSEKQRKWHRKPDQDVFIVGPSTPKQRADALGIQFVEFLRDAGALLVQTETSDCFVRNRHDNPTNPSATP